MTETLHPELPVERSSPLDPSPRLGELRTTEPITRLHYPDGHEGWLVTSHELARAVLADRRFSNRAEIQHSPVRAGGKPVPAGPPAKPGMFINMDGTEHSRYRKLLTGQFTVRRMNQLVPRIEQIVADHLASMRAQGPGVDLVEAFALPVPSMVICELLGVPYDEREQFQRDTRTGFSLDNDFTEIMAAFERIEHYVADLVARKRDEPGDDMLSGLIETGELTDEEVTNMGLLLLIAGHETTANMLGIGTLALLENPDQLAALRADPALVDNAVEELLRYLSIIQIGPVRVALEDLELHGVRIKAGDNVTLSVPAANRDPNRFPNPDRLDVRRSASGHVAFGHGVHQCLGQQLARIEMRVGFAALIREFPDLRLAIPASEVPMRKDMGIYGVHRLPVEF
ncbi:cytochrome P450 [Actinosynnema sp. NPDC047251]|uniref:Cytochrome P450, 105C1 family n=1 Tax=Saccharothrix espanaensis (strain ATCC 51144 / DSM 44229 / JCM 9112 / NBRC 15066 / NRRL 15764) TaxID=1179773 RepID=K0JSK8_SACES|nr:cytochrome P450 [Saccharothrix espanaensis]CCH28866.1 Cytochrome P450, 105C1 family [Saccharothrix espanaensis DSM 44229]